MAFKTTLNYSPNFNSFKRGKKSIKFIIFHYTGMKKESSAINRLTNIQSMVSSHYVIKKSGEILTLVPDAYVSWHAGNSSWKEYKNLNENSIGIEITNPGHNFNYREYSKKQIISLMKLSKFLIKKYNINQKNILGHSDISPDRKKDPGERFPWKYLAKTKIGVWHTITNQILIKNRTIKVSKKEEKYFLNNLYKFGYSKKGSRKLSKDKYLTFLIKAFQRRFRQELINGQIDRECLFISQNLLKYFI